MTCWRRLRAWTQAGVWDQLHALLLAELHAGDQIDWTRAAVDASHVRVKGEDAIGPSPVDRARPGSKHHVLTDATGIPLAVLLTGGNRHDVTQLKPLLDAVPPIRGGSGGRGASRACWSPTAAMTSINLADVLAAFEGTTTGSSSSAEPDDTAGPARRAPRQGRDSVRQARLTKRRDNLPRWWS
jgi:transposase